MSDPNRRELRVNLAPARVRFVVELGIVVALAALMLPAAIASAAVGVGSFRVACAPSHDGTFDPIVFPGQSPAGHQHEFYGSTATGPSSSPGSLIGSSTTCSDSADSSGYWHPTVFFNGVRAPASLASVYYTQRTTKKPTDNVEAWPAGLRVIAGDAHAQVSQSDFIVWWDCDGATMDRQATAPTCPTNSRGLEANARFPDCWDGANLDSADHKSHMSYSANDGSGVFRCDAAHPVALPYLHMIFRWDGQYPAGESVTLSSGSTLTFHADFMNGWNQVRLQSLIDQCIKTQTECGRIDSGSQPSPVVTTTSPPVTATTAGQGASTTVTTHVTHASTTGATTATTARNHTTARAAVSISTTEVSTVTVEASATITTMAVGSASDTVSSASGPLAGDTSRIESGSTEIGTVAVALGIAVVAAGLWSLARWGYSRLRKSVPSRD